MNEHHIKYAVICGTIESIEKYTKADKRFIPGYQDFQDTLIPIKQFEEYVQTGKIKVFGEVMAVYKGQKLTRLVNTNTAPSTTKIIPKMPVTMPPK